jgi:DNA-binding NarL/FixJ family response regulator
MASIMLSTDTAQKTVLLVDDHPLIRRGFANVIESRGDLAVIGEAEDSDGALLFLSSVPVDLAIVDLILKDCHGLELIKQIRKTHESTRILVVSMYDEGLFIHRARRAGAHGYVHKRASAEVLMEAIDTVLAGQLYFRASSDGLNGENMSEDSDRIRLTKLTDREIEVFTLIGQGLTTREIAARLHRSVKTVESFREKIKKKLEYGSSAELTRYAIRWVLQRPLEM